MAAIYEALRKRFSPEQPGPREFPPANGHEQTALEDDCELMLDMLPDQFDGEAFTDFNTNMMRLLGYRVEMAQRGSQNTSNRLPLQEDTMLTIRTRNRRDGPGPVEYTEIDLVTAVEHRQNLKYGLGKQSGIYIDAYGPILTTFVTHFGDTPFSEITFDSPLTARSEKLDRYNEGRYKDERIVTTDALHALSARMYEAYQAQAHPESTISEPGSE